MQLRKWICLLLLLGASYATLIPVGSANSEAPFNMWPQSSPSSAFVERRAKLAVRLKQPTVFFSGLSRPRNYPHNRYLFRAESHFLYFVGRHLEHALLHFEGQRTTLFVRPPDPESELWTGREPSLAELSQELAIEVRPFDEFRADPATLTLPPQDEESAVLLSELLGRDVQAGSGAAIEEPDASLADSIIDIRLSHDGAAQEQLRQAARVADLAHRAGMRHTRAGLREAAVRAQMEAAIVGSGCVCSYNPIVTVNGEVLHNERSTTLMAASDLLLADVGAETPEGWASDVTRVWPVSGKFSGAQRDIYQAVLAAQRAALGAVRPGIRYLDVHRTAGKVLLEGLIALGIFRGDLEELYARGAVALFFPHGVGHLLGLDVHDMEDLGDRAGYAPGRVRSAAFGDRYLRLDRDLAPGMAVTIEPGFYQIQRLLSDPSEVGDLEDALNREALARFADVRGIRIEDDVLVTATGSEVLTAAIPKDVAEVEAAMRAAN